MKKYLPRYILGLAILLVMLGHSARVYQIGFINHLDSIIYDQKIRLTMPRTVDDRIAILDIDEKSLAEQGRWPWGRDKLARLMDQLFDHYGVRLVGFDVVFAEPDASSGLASLEQLGKRELRGVQGFEGALRELRPKLDYDARFAAALKNRPVILGYYFSSREGGQNSGVLPAPTFGAGTFDRRDIGFTRWATYGANLEPFQKAAAGAGHFNPIVDFDGISRRVPLIAEYQGQYYESLSLAMVRALLDFPPVEAGFPDGPGAGYGAMEWLDLKTAQGGALRVPVDENVASLIPYRGFAGSFPYYSLTDVLNGKVPKEKLGGRIVLVGTTAPGLMDLRATPVDSAYPGVEVHANLISGMLDGVIKYKPSYILGADVLLILIGGVVMALLLPRLSPFRATVVAAVVFIVHLSINFAFWYSAHVVLPLASALMVGFLLYALNMSWGYFIESRSKRQFTELFGQYVPPELVDEMARNPAGYTMDGRKQELTVLFSDVRGFTTISEGLQPDQLAALMNEYLGAMTLVVRKHRGTLDKYIGDAIMAFWGAPVADAEHARNAVLTALDMHVALAELNVRLKAKGWPELKIGVGVNTGPMTVGDMGSIVRKAYTVMGDAVNLGSRLEGITKQYGVGTLVGEETRAVLGKTFVFRELDRVRVKGKVEPIGIYEPLGEEGRVSADDLDELKLWNQVLRHYRAQDWDQAELGLLNLSRMKPRYLYELYGKRIEHLRAEPPGEQWDGVTTFETK
jgi:adenylate cyclase